MAGTAPSVTDASALPISPVKVRDQGSEKMKTTEERPDTIAAQRGLTLHKQTFEIEGVGEFNRSDGQPLYLNAYPPVVKPTELLEDNPYQAYRGQKLVDPAVIRPRHTSRERLQRQEEAQQRRRAGGTFSTLVGLAGMTKSPWYSGEP